MFNSSTFQWSIVLVHHAIDNRGRKRDWKRARIYLATAFYPCYQCVVTKFSEVLVLLVIGLTAKESVYMAGAGT